MVAQLVEHWEKDTLPDSSPDDFGNGVGEGYFGR